MSEQNDGGHGYTFVYRGNVVRVHTECGDGITRVLVEEVPAKEQENDE